MEFEKNDIVYVKIGSTYRKGYISLINKDKSISICFGKSYLVIGGPREKYGRFIAVKDSKEYLI